MEKQKSQAKTNLVGLSENPYPGRGIVMGLDETGKNLVQIYWIMGRSANSRNRIFVKDDENSVNTAPADASKVEDASLIIYTAMKESSSSIFAVSNGHQTGDAIGMDFVTFINEWKYEPDHPNYTHRITGLIDIGTEKDNLFAGFIVLKKSPFSNRCNMSAYELDISEPGLGYCVTTYSGDGNPLPSFEGDPYLLPILGDIKDVGKSIWENLNEENRVSLVVKFINIESQISSIEIINKYEAVI